MPRRFPGIASVFHFLSLTTLVLLTQSSPSIAATSCEPEVSYKNWIGLEYTADPTKCIPEDMNDNTIFDHYDVNSVQCTDKVITLENQEAQELDVSPSNIITYYKSQGFRVFRNKQGSHIVVLSSDYNGFIGGTADSNNMSTYLGGKVYTNVFKEAFLPPSSAPDCQGGDFNNGCNEEPGGSSINLGTGRLSHDQRIFAVNSGLPLATV